MALAGLMGAQDDWTPTTSGTVSTAFGSGPSCVISMTGREPPYPWPMHRPRQSSPAKRRQARAPPNEVAPADPLGKVDRWEQARMREGERDPARAFAMHVGGKDFLCEEGVAFRWMSEKNRWRPLVGFSHAGAISISTENPIAISFSPTTLPAFLTTRAVCAMAVFIVSVSTLVASAILPGHQRVLQLLPLRSHVQAGHRHLLHLLPRRLQGGALRPAITSASFSAITLSVFPTACAVFTLATSAMAVASGYARAALPTATTGPASAWEPDLNEYQWADPLVRASIKSTVSTIEATSQLEAQCELLCRRPWS